MKLVVYELKAAGLEQTLVPNKNVILHSVRPHLIRFNRPAGTLKMQVLDSDDNLIAESASLDIDDIGTMDFAHGVVKFDLLAGLTKNQTYKFKLIGEGYTFSESAYVGWCNGFDLEIYPPSYSPETSLQYPLLIENWERTTK